MSYVHLTGWMILSPRFDSNIVPKHNIGKPLIPHSYLTLVLTWALRCGYVEIKSHALIALGFASPLVQVHGDNCFAWMEQLLEGVICCVERIQCSLSMLSSRHLFFLRSYYILWPIAYVTVPCRNWRLSVVYFDLHIQSVILLNFRRKAGFIRASWAH